ncbi:Histone-lysine N-methyltransferase ATX5 [Camellia lanceoleosa]|uniref:Histone-lysine N-methyltransferase ATX5 n=1 Tax=Camellia lanceoleosa TaxID=1840588 RepID=A0ACC0GL48_9ERIC|nr:Histone-lysine N-methyltransferase ATX5 [Camellia lanceoleosa]
MITFRAMIVSVLSLKKQALNEWERHTGSKAKNWKTSVRVKGSILPLEQWMLQIAEYHARTVVSVNCLKRPSIKVLKAEVAYFFARRSKKKTGFGGRSKVRTGGDGCICYLEHDRDQQNLEFLGMKQVKEMSLVRCVFDATSSNDLTSGSYAVGFSSTNFLIWNLMSEAKVVQVPCGGWRRPYAYYLGDVPEIKNCFAFVKKTAREKVLEDYEKIVEAAAKQIKGCTEFEKGVINEKKDSEFVLLILQD